jgi:transposase
LRCGGERRGSEGLFSYIRLEERLAKDHPLRAIRALVDKVLTALSGRFEELYSHTGRPSIAPEYLLRATLLQAFFTVRSERQLMEQIDYNLLFRWLVGLSIDDRVWDASTFCKNRDRLLEAKVAHEFLATLLALPKVKRLLSGDHFSVDGTLLKAWAGMKSFRPKDGPGSPPAAGRNGERNFRREKRSNKTHASTTDPDAKLYRKGDGQENRLCFMGHVLMENRNGLAVLGDVTQATERPSATAPSTSSTGIGQDDGGSPWAATRATMSKGFVSALRERDVTPHILLLAWLRHLLWLIAAMILEACVNRSALKPAS